MAWEPVAEVPALGESACQVWWACPGEVTPGHLAMLDPAERDRHGRYLRAQDRDRFAAVASYVLAAEELALLRQLPPPEQPAGFASYWVRKEAVVKATGDGLRARLAGLVVSDPMAGPRLLRWDERPDIPGRVTLRTLSPGGGYAACVALLDQRAAAVSELSGSALLQAWGQRAAPARPRP